MPVRLKDIARLTGVSTSTVSRVLNDDPRISPETSIRVKACLSHTGYTMNTIARSLKTKKTHTVGFIAPELVNDFFMNIAEAAEASLRGAGYSMFICNSKENPSEEKRQLELLAEKCVDGIIWIPVSPEGGHFRKISSSGIPVIAVDRLPDCGGIDAVLVDNTGGTRKAVTHILDAGYTRIGFIGGDMSLTSARERYEGYCLALESRNISPDRKIIRFGDFHIRSGYSLMTELMELASPPEYIFIANYFMHIGAAKYLAETSDPATGGFNRSVGIAHFDEMEITSILGFSSLTIKQPMKQIGRKAADLLLGRIRSNRPDTEQPQIIRLATELIEHTNPVKPNCGSRIL